MREEGRGREGDEEGEGNAAAGACPPENYQCASVLGRVSSKLIY